VGVVPTKDIEAIQFFESHIPVWQSHAAAIGVLAANVTSLDTATKAARTAVTDQFNAKQAAKAATTGLNNAVDAMRNVGGDLIKTIKAFADTTNNPNVFTIAQVPPPAPPSPAPPPGQPEKFKVELTPSGAILLSWKAKNAAASGGVYFSVRRKLNTEAEFHLVGNTGSKSFVDDTITQGTTGATYIVQGYRGLNAGEESEQVAVQFGVGAGRAAPTLNIAA